MPNIWLLGRHLACKPFVLFSVSGVQEHAAIRWLLRRSATRTVFLKFSNLNLS